MTDSAEYGATFDPLKVDITAMAADGTVELIIVVDAAWTGSDDELQALQSKCQTYVSFAIDGQMFRQYPETQGKPWSIVVAINPPAGAPDGRTQIVLDHLAQVLPQYGGQLAVRYVS